MLGMSSHCQVEVASASRASGMWNWSDCECSWTGIRSLVN